MGQCIRVFMRSTAVAARDVESPVITISTPPQNIPVVNGQSGQEVSLVLTSARNVRTYKHDPRMPNWAIVFQYFCDVYNIDYAIRQAITKDIIWCMSTVRTDNIYLYVETLSEACMTRSASSPSLQRVAGHVITFYIRWAVMKMNVTWCVSRAVYEPIDFSSHDVPSTEVIGDTVVERLKSAVTSIETCYIFAPLGKCRVRTMDRMLYTGVLTFAWKQCMLKYKVESKTDLFTLTWKTNVIHDYRYDYFEIMYIYTYCLCKSTNSCVPMETVTDMYFRVAIHCAEEQKRSPVREIVNTTFAHLRQGYIELPAVVLNGAGTNRFLRDKNNYCTAYTLQVNGHKDFYRDLTVIGKHMQYDVSVGANITAFDFETYNGVSQVLTLFDSIVRTNVGSPRSHVTHSYTGAQLLLYMELWHSHIYDFVRHCSDNSHTLTSKTKCAFTAVMLPDIFNRRVKCGGLWSLFNVAREGQYLLNTFGDDFDRRYLELEEKCMYVEQVPANGLWSLITNSQHSTRGLPILIMKDKVPQCLHRHDYGIHGDGHGILYRPTHHYTKVKDCSILQCSIDMRAFISRQQADCVLKTFKILGSRLTDQSTSTSRLNIQCISLPDIIFQHVDWKEFEATVLNAVQISTNLLAATNCPRNVGNYICVSMKNISETLLQYNICLTGNDFQALRHRLEKMICTYALSSKTTVGRLIDIHHNTCLAGEVISCVSSKVHNYNRNRNAQVHVTNMWYPLCFQMFPRQGKGK